MGRRAALATAVAAVFLSTAARAEVIEGPAVPGKVVQVAMAPAEGVIGTDASDVVDAPPTTRVIARVDISDQTMHVYVDNVLTHVWPVSTGRGSYRTPTGQWNAAWLSPRHRSRRYNNAPMPWSVFFYNGYAVHGTTATRQLGSPASHGCVRLLTANAEVFYRLTQSYGLDQTLVSITR